MASIITTSLETITPAIAKDLLASSVVNRDTSAFTVLAYKIQMLKKLWKPWPGLDVDKDGHLLNGHHRCRAIIEAGIPVDLYVSRGLDKDTQEIMDTGSKRTITQQLKMYRRGVKNRASIASYVSVCTYLLTGTRVRLSTIQDFEQWQAAFRKGLKWAELTLISSPLCRPGPIAGSLAFAWLSDPPSIEDFGEKLVSGEGLRRGDPAHTLRRVLEKTSPGSRVGSYRNGMAHKVLNAARAHVLGEKMHRVSPNGVGRKYFVEAYASMKKAQALAKPWIITEELSEEELGDPVAGAKKEIQAVLSQTILPLQELGLSN